jgi:8-oxo-dGTP pyrophosphatase MutT (NUDIX family)
MPLVGEGDQVTEIAQVHGQIIAVAYRPAQSHQVGESLILLAMSLRSTRLSAGVVVVRRHGDGWLYLLLRAFNHWDFPKGMVEPGEEPLAAAIREVEEESTIADLDFAWGEDSTQTGPYSGGKIARYYLASTQTSDVELPVNPLIGRPEHSEYRWADFDEAIDLVSPRVKPVLRWAAQALTRGAGAA